MNWRSIEEVANAAKGFGVPPGCAWLLADWIGQGRYGGGFMISLLSGDLLAAALNADPANARAFVTIVRWLQYEAPARCWGSPTRMSAWNVHRGLGLPERHQEPADLAQAAVPARAWAERPGTLGPLGYSAAAADADERAETYHAGRRAVRVYDKGRAWTR